MTFNSVCGAGGGTKQKKPTPLLKMRIRNYFTGVSFTHISFGVLSHVLPPPQAPTCCIFNDPLPSNKFSQGAGWTLSCSSSGLLLELAAGAGQARCSASMSETGHTNVGFIQGLQVKLLLLFKIHPAFLQRREIHTGKINTPVNSKGPDLVFLK